MFDLNFALCCEHLENHTKSFHFFVGEEIFHSLKLILLNCLLLHHLRRRRHCYYHYYYYYYCFLLIVLMLDLDVRYFVTDSHVLVMI